MTQKPPKLDIFRVLTAANAKNTKFIDLLTDSERNSFVPFLVARWMTGTTDAMQIVLINEILNPYLFSLPNHKKLLWQLSTIANSGVQQRYKWVKPPERKNTQKPTATRVVGLYFKYNTKDAAAALNLLSLDSVVGMATDLGLQHDEITKIKKEMAPSTK